MLAYLRMTFSGLPDDILGNGYRCPEPLCLSKSSSLSLRTSSPLGLLRCRRYVVGDALAAFDFELLSMKIYRDIPFRGIGVVAVATERTVPGM